ACTKGSFPQVGHERTHSLADSLLLLLGESIEISPEAGGELVGRHAWSLERFEELLVAPVALDASRLDVFGGPALAGLPGGGPEPGLRRVDRLPRAKENPISGHLDLDGISFLEAGGLSDFGGNSDLALPSNDGDFCCHGALLGLPVGSVYRNFQCSDFR